MSLPFLGKAQNTQVVATIEFKPDTLFFTAPERCWLSGEIFMNGVRIGKSNVEMFSPQEITALTQIVLNAVDRHHEYLKHHGNL